MFVFDENRQVGASGGEVGVGNAHFGHDELCQNVECIDVERRIVCAGALIVESDHLFIAIDVFGAYGIEVLTE